MKPKPLSELEARIGVRFSDHDRLQRALTHSSFRSAKGDGRSYERLEFLGDRVLGLVIAGKLFEMFPDADEGELSLRLNALVNAETCAAVADELGLYDYVRQGGDLKRLAPARTKSIRADLMESLIAAIYLNSGLEDARTFIENHWGDRLGKTVAARRDPKTALQEWAHQRGPQTPTYEVVDRSGPDHNPKFTIRVTIDGVKPSDGEGASKRLAEQAAAVAMLIRENVWKDDQ
ncbi:ribonuclease III [Fulvimarina sp. 2208YS6-2-32]|uniref:Ribonuclease 3 n=1 Tax=Fulvimarina uroteuthidis TaxID=3098149 RepID=A0ABU5I3G4_9HYPH|nr:ribonuclease III [Fulvimarina sp. 2208YS6-2-32]MDY8109313.1 ribonuclease III [Fulvimarina sp. 2208YS6-2-32]